MALKSATLKDVAREAGVSVMTVSMALRNHPRISEATKGKVLAIASQLGYRPNPETQQLMEKVRANRKGDYTPTIAVLDADPSGLVDPYAEAILCGARSRAAQLGYQLETFPIFGKRMSASRLMSVLRTRNITGMLIPPLPKGRAHLRLNWPQLAAVSTTGALWRPKLSAAMPDFFYNACLALREMRRIGYTKIGLYLPVHSDERSRHAFTAAYYWHCIHEGILTPPTIFQEYHDDKLNHWIAANDFDAILGNDYAEHAMLERLGHLETRGYAALAWRREYSHVAGVDLRPENIGMAALDLVDAALRRNEPGLPANPKTITIQGRWVSGISIRARGKPAIPFGSHYPELIPKKGGY